MQSNFSVHREREIDRRCSFGQLDHIAGRREDENLVLVKIELEELEELVRRLRIELELEHLPEPLERAIELVGAARIFLESPVRRDSVLRGAVHLAGANLNLEQLTPWPKHGRVQ